MEGRRTSVLIPSAGRGSRLREREILWPKPLVTFADQPVLMWIINQYPNAQVVVGLGYQAALIQQALEIWFPDRLSNKTLVTFKTESFRDGRGLAGTLLDAEPSIDGDQLIFHACDTVLEGWSLSVAQRLMERDGDFALAAAVTSQAEFRSLRNDGTLGDRQICDVGESAYTGVSGFLTSSRFFRQLRSLEGGTETDVLVANETRSVQIDGVSWYDVGSKEGLTVTQERFPSNFNILPKQKEIFWWRNAGNSEQTRVIKGHLDEDFISERVRRSEGDLKGFVPELDGSTDNFYSYKFVKGQTLASLLDKGEAPIDTLTDYLKSFWTDSRKRAYDHQWLDFYKAKTYERVAPLLSRASEVKSVNQLAVPELSGLVNSAPWEAFSNIVEGRAHGDLHPENIIVSANEIVMLDWRQGFTENDVCDIRYDLFKLMHGAFLRHESISRGDYSFTLATGSATIRISRPVQNLTYLEMVLDLAQWMRVTNDELLFGTGLIFLNIAVLHEPDVYQNWLLALGRMLCTAAMEQPTTTRDEVVQLYKSTGFSSGEVL